MSAAETPKGALAAAVSKRGFGMRFALEPHRELSTRAGRRFAKPADGRRDRRRRAGARAQGRRLRGHQRRARAALQGRRAARAGEPRPRRHRHQGRATTTVVGFGVGRAKDKDVIIAETDDGKELPVGPGRFTRHRARRQGPRAQAQDQDRARDVGRAAGAARAARAAELTMDHGERLLHLRTTSPVLEGLEPVRRRPGMYIGGTDSKGYHHLLWEIVDNSVDEVINGYGSRIEVTLHKDGKSVTVDDDGRGIPVDIKKEYKKSALELVLTTLHAGGKFGAGAVQVLGRPARRRLVGGQRALRGAGRRRSSATATRWEQTYERGKATSQAEEGRARRAAPARRSSSGPTRRSSASSSSRPRRSASGWTRRRSCTRA